MIQEAPEDKGGGFLLTPAYSKADLQDQVVKGSIPNADAQTNTVEKQFIRKAEAAGGNTVPSPSPDCQTALSHKKVNLNRWAQPYTSPPVTWPVSGSAPTSMCAPEPKCHWLPSCDCSCHTLAVLTPFRPDSDQNHNLQAMYHINNSPTHTST